MKPWFNEKSCLFWFISASRPREVSTRWTYISYLNSYKNRSGSAGEDVVPTSKTYSAQVLWLTNSPSVCKILIQNPNKVISNYLSTFMLNSFLSVPKYSDIFCLDTVVSLLKNSAILSSSLSRWPLSIKYWMPTSGFLEMYDYVGNMISNYTNKKKKSYFYNWSIRN